MCKRAKFYARANVISRLEDLRYFCSPNARGMLRSGRSSAHTKHNLVPKTQPHEPTLPSSLLTKADPACVESPLGFQLEQARRSELPSRAQCCAQAGRRATHDAIYAASYAKESANACRECRAVALA